MPPTLIRETPRARAMTPSFSVVTATFRRARELALLLPSIERELARVDAPVEYVLCDNASDDGSHELVLDFVERHPELPIRYYRQAENRGLDHNVLDVLSLARGRFVWFIADDDEIAPGMLQPVIDACEDGDVAAVIVRSNNITEWDAIARTGDAAPVELIPGDLRYARHYFATSFLASLVFRASNVTAHLDEARARFAGTDYAPFGLGLMVMSRASRLRYIDEVCVLGNVNFDGNCRFPAYGVLVKNRVEVASTAASGALREALEGPLTDLVLAGWRSAAAGSLEVGSRRELLREYARSLRRFGGAMASGLPWIAFASVVPLAARRGLRRRVQPIVEQLRRAPRG